MTRSRHLPDEPLHDTPTAAQEPDRGEDTPLRDGERLRVGQALPAALTRGELMELLGIRKSRFYLLQKRGAFDRWKLRPAVGHRIYSGKLVQRWLDCEDGASRFALKLHTRSA